MMMAEVLRSIRNYFVARDDIVEGNFVISGGSISPLPSAVVEGSWYRIVGSRLNDGVYHYGEEDTVLQNEDEFHGEIWCLKIPTEFESLVEEIDSWQESHGSPSGFQSESFGGYTYTKGSGGDGSWQSAFRSRLNPWRKL